MTALTNVAEDGQPLWRLVPPGCLEMVVAIAVVFDQDDKESFEVGKQGSHDNVIALAGRARVSGVQWRVFENTEEFVSEFLGLVDDDWGAHAVKPPAGAREEYVQVRQMVAEHPRGLLIIASVWVDTRVVKAGQS